MKKNDMNELKGQLQEDIAESTSAPIEQEQPKHTGIEVSAALKKVVGETDRPVDVVAMVTVHENNGVINVYVGDNGESRAVRTEDVDAMGDKERAQEHARLRLTSLKDALRDEAIHDMGQDAYDQLPAAGKQKVLKKAENAAYSKFTTQAGYRNDAAILRETDLRMQMEFEKREAAREKREAKKTISSPTKNERPGSVNAAMPPDDTSIDDQELIPEPSNEATFSNDMPTSQDAPEAAPVKDNGGNDIVPEAAPVATTPSEDTLPPTVPVEDDNETLKPAPIRPNGDEVPPATPTEPKTAETPPPTPLERAENLRERAQNGEDVSLEIEELTNETIQDDTADDEVISPAPNEVLAQAIENGDTAAAEDALQNLSTEEQQVAKSWLRKNILENKKAKRFGGKMLILLIVYLSIELTLVAKTSEALKKG